MYMYKINDINSYTIFKSLQPEKKTSKTFFQVFLFFNANFMNIKSEK